MKLNYRDRVILLIVIAVVILVGGFVGLIKPRYNDITDNKAHRDEVQEEWDGLDAKIQQIPELKESIKQTKASADDLSKNFYSGEELANGELIGFMKPYQLDQYMQSIVDESKIKVISMEAGEITDSTLNYYYYTPVVPTTAILDLADLNGNYSAEISEKFKESDAIALRIPGNLFVQQYGINVKATKENLRSFMTKINEMDKAIRIDSISISDINFGTDPETGKAVAGAETIDGEGISQVTMVLNLYSVYELDEPVLE